MTAGLLGLAELTLSPLMSIGDTATGVVSVEYLLHDPLGILQDETGTVDIDVTAQAAAAAVPEPSTWLLVATGMVATLGWRRRQISSLSMGRRSSLWS
jgi:hypothetical protein